MQVINPVDIAGSNIISTNAVNTYADWSSTATYSKTDRVTYNSYYWESLVDSNTNQNPESTTLQWVKVSPSNKSAMFDMQISSQTITTGNLEVSIKPGKAVNCLTLFNLSGLEVTLQVLDTVGGTEIYNKTVGLDGTYIQDWYSYFFDEYSFRQEVVFNGIPPYLDCVINLTVTPGTGGEAKVGSFVTGTLVQIGETQQGMSYGIRDYSLKETDEFGVVSFVQRNFSKRMHPTVFVNNGRLNYVSKLLTNIRAKPTAWMATTDDRFEGTIVYGYYKDFNIEVPYPNHSLISIEIEGLI